MQQTINPEARTRGRSQTRFQLRRGVSPTSSRYPGAGVRSASYRIHVQGRYARRRLDRQLSHERQRNGPIIDSCSLGRRRSGLVINLLLARAPALIVST